MFQTIFVHTKHVINNQDGLVHNVFQVIIIKLRTIKIF